MAAIVQIMPATATDIPELSQLLTLLFSQEADFTPDQTAQNRGLAQIIGDPATGLILVARQSGQIVGMVNLLYTVSTALGGRVALLEDMVVTPSARGFGVGSQLLDYAIKSARQHGCKRITLLTDRLNGPAQRFYQKHGFGRSAMVPLRLALDGADGQPYIKAKHHTVRP